MKKKKYNATSILGLAIEAASLLTMAVYYYQGNPIPRSIAYVFMCGFIIAIAGAAISIRDNRK